MEVRPPYYQANYNACAATTFPSIMNKLKVFFVTETFLPAHIGGTEMYLFNLCKELQKKEIYCKVFCEGEEEEYQEYLHENVPVQLCPSADAESIFKSLSKAKATEGFDILHIHSFNGQINNNFFSKLHQFELPLFFTPHLVNNFCSNNNGSLRFKNKIECNGVVGSVKCQTCTFSNYEKLPFLYRTTLLHFIIHRLLPIYIAKRFFSKHHFVIYEKLERIQLLNKQKVGVIALSKWYAELLKRNQIVDVTLIQQGVSRLFISKGKTGKHQETMQSVQWIFVGRMSKEKGVKELIEVFQQVDAPGDRLTIITIKPKSADGYFEEIVDTIEADERIALLFNQSGEDVSELLASADCLVLPSKITEMAPLVVQEAIASNKPVLVSDYIRDDVEKEGTGLKFSFEKVGDFLKKMKEIRGRLRPFITINNARSLTFEQVAADHIFIYRDRKMNKKLD